MSKPVQLFCWHFMAYPYLPADFDEKYDSGWITVPNTLWDREKSRGLLNEYIDQLAYADTLGFDGMVLNEHHQNVYGLMLLPNIIASSSPETVYRQIIDLVRETQVGNLLIQFHLGNMRDDLARKSMRLFATQVAPRLREDSRVAFASSFAELADTP